MFCRRSMFRWIGAIILFITLALPFELIAQECLSGDCHDGKGKLEYADGSIYLGTFHANKRHGFGSYRYPNGDYYEGAWMHDQMQGKGIYVYHNGDRYEGEFKRGMMHGEGTFQFEDGSIYHGGWEYDQRKGPGTWTKPDGTEMTGIWTNGKLKGKGKKFYLMGFMKANLKIADARAGENLWEGAAIPTRENG